MNQAKIIVAGIGPGSTGDITSAVIDALRHCDAVVGYHYYFPFIEAYLPADALRIDSGMKQERRRAEEAFRVGLRKGAPSASSAPATRGFMAWPPLSLR